MTDQAFSALLDDLQQRGMLDETLIVWTGEMGRTPRVGQGVVGGAGAGLPDKIALRNAPPDAPCRVRSEWLKQLTRARGTAVLSQSVARSDARDGQADTRHPARRCCSTGIRKLNQASPESTLGSQDLPGEMQ